MIKIYIKWNDQRNISRLFSWLGIDSTWNGKLFRIEPFQPVGYKTSNKKYLIFNFYDGAYRSRSHRPRARAFVIPTVDNIYRRKLKILKYFS